mmetsp:Transcript_105581/g.315367  ORF Transcript_105581/g.315367 Transcript_105581/m.315367 type:complete len:336 (+) Transcript_105581:272-1279(+)
MREQRDSRALAARTPGTANAVHVVLGVARRVEVDDHGDGLDVKTSRGDVGRDEDLGLAGLEGAQSHVSLALVPVAVDGLALHAHALKAPVELVAHALGLRKDDHLAIRLAQAVHKLALLLADIAADDDLLLDVGVGLELVGVADPDLHGIAEEVLGHPAHFLRPGSGEHHRLPPRGDVADDLPDLRLEAHVEHSVGLVQNQEAHVAQVDHPALQEVVQAAGCARQQVGPPPEVSELGALGRAAVGQRCENARRPGKALGVGVDLARQLSRRRHDEQDRRAREALVQDLRDGREQEPERLPRACLRDADQVATLAGDGPRVGLDGARRLEARLEHG